MLFYSGIGPKTLQLLKSLQQLDKLQDFLLVGGTSLALQIGHRISVDLDLFSFNTTIEIANIPDLINHLGRVRIVNQSPSILNLFINDIKVDFVTYKYEFLKPGIFKDNLRLASIPDVAAMKLAAITGRGSKKDFIDLFFLLKSFPLSELFKFYLEKYPDGSDFLVYKSLTYFEDAEIEPMPKMIETIDWEEVKSFIVAQIKNHFP